MEDNYGMDLFDGIATEGQDGVSTSEIVGDIFGSTQSTLDKFAENAKGLVIGLAIIVVIGVVGMLISKHLRRKAGMK